MKIFSWAGRSWFWVFVVVSVVGAGIASLFGIFQAKPDKTEALLAGQNFVIPTFSENHFLNAQPGVAFIGSAACAACHAQNHQSYLHTAHSRSLSDIDLNAEPPDSAFEHKLSGCSYRIYRQDGQIHHEEVLRTAGGKELSRTDFPVRYLIGSGQYSRGYIVEADGFLVLSPLTWYASKQKYAMSPGYDVPLHWGFERPIRLGCVVCHAGRVEQKEGSVHRFTFHEKAIGCESCHGPGSLHQDLRRSRKLAIGEEDFSIVHPGKLSRANLESICAACHQSSPASIPLRGRGATDYRPGRPLNDYRIHYYFDSDNDQMSVVGHMEQLRESACYKNSPGLSCITCHDLHQSQKPKDSIAFYRNKCLACHNEKPCKLKPIERLKKQPQDDCTACHMPRGDTDIPHVAFSHHRIGLHNGKPIAIPERLAELVASDDKPDLEPLDRQRNLGLAYYEVSLSRNYAKFAETYEERARKQLEAVYSTGLRDGVTAYTLAEIFLKKKDFSRAYTFAQDALAAADTPSFERAVCLLMLADRDRQHRDPSAAIPLLEEAIRSRRSADNWRILGMCHLEQDQPGKALTAFQNSLSIRPYRSIGYLNLSQTYSRLGDASKAHEFQEKGRWLQDQSK